jgi:hypothetical protein
LLRRGRRYFFALLIVEVQLIKNDPNRSSEW